MNDYKGKAVVVTGGTKGIGLATGLAFGRHGAHVYLTHAWGSADEGEIKKQFADAGAPEPGIVEADASRDEDTAALYEVIKKDHDGVEVFISNVCVVDIAKGIQSFKKKTLFRSLEYSSWPLIAYVIQTKKVFGRYPRYVVGMSSDGIDHFYEGYEYVAITKAVMEVFGRYLTQRLRKEDCRVNMIRTRNVITESALTVHGQAYPDFVRKYGGEGHFVQSEEVADAALALCSGMLDAMNGQILTVDRGSAFADNMMFMYRNREKLGCEGCDMLKNDLKGKAVLITGGTKGIGLACGLRFGREGAKVYLTHKWGSADEGLIKKQFADAGAPEPGILEGDAAEKDDTIAVLEAIKKEHDAVEVFISNVAFAAVLEGMDTFKKRRFLKSLGYSAWPFVGYLQQHEKIFGKHPRYVIGMSSDGNDNYYPGYDFVGAAKTVMEVFCQYFAIHTFEDDVRMNVLRGRPVATESLEATFGPEFEPFLRKYGGDDYLITCEELADAALCLCSGLMDGVSGQVITLDNGVAFSDNVMRLFEEREQRGL